MLQFMVQTAAAWVIPAFIFIVLVYAVMQKVDVFDTFVEGAKEGYATSISLIPYLVAMLVAIGLLRASGALELLIKFLSPLLTRFNVPGEIIPLALMRPLSGSGALGVTAEILNNFGADSFIGRLASTMQGSTDTTFFILTVYFGSVGIRKSRHALTVGLLADLAAFIASIVICTLVFQ